jgi:hypothetical protein
VSSDLFYGEIYLTNLKVYTFLSRNLYGRYPKDFKFQNSEVHGMRYEVHEVGSKDYGSQNFSFLASIGTELVSIQISATATARYRRKYFYRSNHIFFRSLVIFVSFW